METLQNIFQMEIIQRLGWTLVHFVWQAMAAAMVLAIVLKLLQKYSANLRYIIACIALVLIVLIGAITFRMVDVSVPAIEPVKLKQVGIDLPKAQAVVEMPQVESPSAQVAATPRISLKDKFIGTVEPALPYVVVGWLVGVFGLSLWHLGGWTQLQRLRRRMVKQVTGGLKAKMQQLSNMLGIQKTIGLVESALVQVPTVVGHLKPVILLPASALTGLSSEQIEAILAHELAHIKRCDYLVNMLQTVVEILGFYHPAVWWISDKIRVERENCCDDIAISLCSDSLCYARALTTMEEIRFGQPALAVAASGGSLFDRIRRLLGKDSANEGKLSWLPSATAILLIMALLIPAAFALTNRPKTTTKPATEKEKTDYSAVTIAEKIAQLTKEVQDLYQEVLQVQASMSTEIGPRSSMLDKEQVEVIFEKKVKTIAEQKFSELDREFEELDMRFESQIEPQLQKLTKEQQQSVDAQLNELVSAMSQFGNQMKALQEYLKSESLHEAQQRTKQLQKRTESMEKLKWLGLMCHIYANERNGKFPDNLEELKPYDENEILNWALENVGYLGQEITAETDPQAFIAYDRKMLLEKGETNIVFYDGHVGFCDAKRIEDIGLTDIVPQILTSGYILSVPADLPQLKGIISDYNSKAKMITPRKLQEFLKVIDTTPGARRIAAPKILTNDGQDGQIRTEDDEGLESVKLSVKNTVGADKKTVKLELDLEYSVSAGQDISSTSVSTTATVLSDHAIAIAGGNPIDGQTVLLIVKPQVLERASSKTGVVQTENPLGQIESFKRQLQEPVTVDIDKSPDGDRLTVQYAVMAVCEAAGVPYNWNKSAELADPQRRHYIDPVNIKDNTASQAIADMVGPVGLLYSVDSTGVYLYKPEQAAVIQGNLEILNIELEPVAQGKNILYATVKNTSDAQQLFAVHIYTRSVDYGPQGIGWGTRFFEKIGSSETKRARFAYKIQGPITDNTYVRVKFYNPATQEEYNYDKPFAVRVYKSSDLEREVEEKSEESISFKDFAKILIGNFKKVQRFIKEKKYEQAWGLLSEDYQKSEYQSRGLENFKLHMEPEHPLHAGFHWDKSQFLKLKPEGLELENPVTLLAVYKKETWKISFVREGDGWKIDDIVGYRLAILDMQEADNR